MNIFIVVKLMLKKIIMTMLLLIIVSGCNKKNEPLVINTGDITKIIDPNLPVVALTFDDGPSKYTTDILEFLKENDACATFFVVGNKAKTFSNTLNTMIKNGNEIGNHSYSHKWLSRLSTENIKSEINLTQNTIESITNYTPKLLRPTYGSINKKLRNSTNLKIILWNVDTKDWKLKSSEEIAKRALNSIEDGDIVLMHDMYERTYNALKIIIPALKEKGYQFVTVSELEEIKKLKEKAKE